MTNGEHLDPSLEINLDTVKKRAVRGILTLTGRTFVLNVISFAAQGFLWAYLDQYQFGVFWVVSAVVNFLAYFSDIGLAAALIQKKDKPEEKDLRTIFTVQQSLVLTLLCILFLASPILTKTHNLTTEGTYLLYALGISFFLSSLKSIPSVLLERKLEFGKFVIPQVLESFVYSISVVYFAWQGYGITSFTYAVLIRGVVGLVAIYVLEPWKPGLAFSKSSLKRLLSFGVPYQLNTFLAVLKDDGVTILLGGILGPAGVGVLGTAQRLAQYPLRFFMDNVTKVTFPAFSRMQDSKSDLERSLTRSMFFICFLVFPSIVGLVVVAPVLVQVIPGYAKWQPAIIPLMLISVNTIFAAVTTQLTNVLNATGRIKITFFLMIMWTTLTWVLVPYLSKLFGVNGAALGYALVGSSSAIAIYIARRFVGFSLFEAVLKPLVATLIMAICLIFVRSLAPYSLLSMGLLVILGIIVYFVASYVLIGANLLHDVRHSLRSVFTKG